MMTRILLLILLATSSCMMHSKQNPGVHPMSEKHRPQLHFSPATNWTNDPNGMFWLDGKYHLFFQHNPEKPVWGPMYWGHAISEDLVHWEHLPIALSPDSLGYIFSGCGVFDAENTSGLGTLADPPVVLIYTYHSTPRERAGYTDYQSQGLAFSLDSGSTWTKYRSNPVISNPGGVRDFRDPKVRWDEPRNQWVMTLAVKDHVEFYVSGNLLDWKKSGEFGRTSGSHGGVWECPDLFPLVGDDGVERFVLLVSINPGAPNGGSGTQYFIGDFNGQAFVSEDGNQNRGWVDLGTDNYAGVTYSNVPNGRTIALGWMSNWEYAQKVPTTTWRNAMTIPRQLQLRKINDRQVLTSIPVKEIEKQRGPEILSESASHQPTRLPKSIHLPADQIELLIDFEKSSPGKTLSVSLSNAKGEELIIGLDSMNRFYIDRRKSGDVTFNRSFGAVHFAPRISDNPVVKLRILLDTSSIELFADDGASVMTDIVFPSQPYNLVTIKGSNDGITVINVAAFALNSIWR